MTNNYDTLHKLVSDAIKTEFTDQTKKPQKYSSIEEYTKVTGKRFRVTKEQKERGMSREDAFKEFMSKA